MDAQAAQLIAAAITMLGMLSVGFGQGYVAGKAVESTARNPEAHSKIMSLMIIGCAIIETCSIYCLIIAILLLFVMG